MDLVSLFLIAFGLSMDSFAVSVSSGIILPGIRFNKAVIIAFSLAFFQGLLPLIGWIIGLSVQDFIKPIDHWVAFILLTVLGIKMIIESRKKEEDRANFNPLKPAVLITMSIATSIDALIVGMSLSFISMKNTLLWMTPVLIIGGVTFIMSMLGILFGKKVGNQFGKRMETVGGIILFLIGVRIIAEHLLF
ncbi:MAG: manganese efflux pump MntP family protein [Omnitrophica WOR_2 bacterium]|jgi:putative Mn2+ efflux pump MntP